MRLINVHTLELKDFVAQPPPYAILSHRWTDSEVSYKEFLKRTTGESSGFIKIRQFCEFVRRFPVSNDGKPIVRAKPSCSEPSPPSSHTIDWAWVDTCCIDKRSSAELSEAINSMWKWYQHAVFCVAFLADVPSLQNGRDIALQRLMKSDWFNRGWTLQELLAPKELIFTTSEWEYIGMKRDKDVLQILINRTSIEEQYLAFPESIAYASVAQKFSWCSQRVTTRDEDIAYCLLGLLKVNMPLLYGEGGVKAFRRLQFELIASSSDESIFAWDASPFVGNRESLAVEDVLALHPGYFENAGAIRLIQPRDKEYIRRPPFFVTHQGISFESPAKRLRPVQKNLETKSVEHQNHLRHFLGITKVYLVPLNCRDRANPSNLGNDRFVIALTVQDGAVSNPRMVGKVVSAGFEDAEIVWRKSSRPKTMHFQLDVGR